MKRGPGVASRVPESAIGDQAADAEIIGDVEQPIQFDNKSNTRNLSSGGSTGGGGF